MEFETRATELSLLFLYKTICMTMYELSIRYIIRNKVEPESMNFFRELLDNSTAKTF